MSKRGLYSTLSIKREDEKDRLMMNFISLCDGESSILEISDRLNVPIWDLYAIVDKLEKISVIVMVKED